MKLSYDLSIEVSQPYDFTKEALTKIEENVWVRNQWPLVYFLQNEKEKIAYVGESTDALRRIKNHLANPKKNKKFNQVSIIGSDKFNKSATLDIEASLIQYLHSENTYTVDNANYGLINHNYYQRDLYRDLFKEIWNKLIDKKIVSKTLIEIENTELFKYSPYKSLNEDQYNSVLEILEALTTKPTNRIFIKGSAGTGKTILATYLIKLLSSELEDINDEEINDNELKEFFYIKEFKRLFPNAKIGLVISMSSLRETLQRVFKKTPGLKSSMVLSPSDTFKINEKYDLLIIDEAHRLRKYKNISWMGAFKKNNQKLDLDDTGTELDWILANSKNQLFFYDEAQSVKPSDVDSSRFDSLLMDDNTLNLELSSQMRVKGGNDYISFVDQLLHVNLQKKEKFISKNYELILFDSLKDLYSVLEEKENEFKLCRLIAGYSWPWLSDPKKKNPTPEAIDIAIDGLEFQWNQEDKDWINSKNAFREVGCIHTTQGYDLNYSGIIFGEEISYNKTTNEIEINPNKYFDKNGKKGTDINDLKSYIINIYKTIMYRGIKGTFIYACNDDLRNYLKEHIESFTQEQIPFRILNMNEVKPYVNAVPFYDIVGVAGSFSDLQIHSEVKWIELPFNVSTKEGYFVCQVVGESMNKKISNGSFCLFRKDEGGSREGKIVLVERLNKQDPDFGSCFTVKEYRSKKNYNEYSWEHESIILRPLSFDSQHEDIILEDDELSSLKVIGIFECIL